MAASKMVASRQSKNGVRPHRPEISKGRRRAVYVRDNWTCQDCGLVFDPEQTWNPGSLAPYIQIASFNNIFLEVDHIYPWIYGGESTLDNLRAACTPCNRRKWFKIPEAV